MDIINYVIPEQDEETRKKRHEISIDDYARFNWRGSDSYDAFGCLITNTKDLKWTNYAGFTDEFTKPMFSSASSYVGTTYTQKEIKLKLGVYWITAEDYRAFLNWITPDVVGDFEYNYNKGWKYRAKVTSVTESTYYSIGYKSTGETVYYAELTVGFKTVEDNSVIATEPWPNPWFLLDNESTLTGYYLFTRWEDEQWNDTELSTSIKFVDTIPWRKDSSTTSTDTIVYQVFLRKFKDELEGQVNISGPEMEENLDKDKWLLFSFTTNSFEDIGDIDLKIEYNSQLGQLLINNALISNQNVLDNQGNEIINTYQVNKMIWPGCLNNKILGRDLWIVGQKEEQDMKVLFKPLVLTILISRNGNPEARWQDEGSGQIDYSVNNIAIYPKREI